MCRCFRRADVGIGVYRLVPALTSRDKMLLGDPQDYSLYHNVTKSHTAILWWANKFAGMALENGVPDLINGMNHETMYIIHDGTVSNVVINHQSLSKFQTHHCYGRRKPRLKTRWEEEQLSQTGGVLTPGSLSTAEVELANHRKWDSG